LEKGARVIVCTHLGRPKSKEDTQYTVKPVVENLKKKLEDFKISFVDDCVGAKVEKAVKNLKGGELLYLENIRFYPEETANDADFARELSKLCDYYVNDAFGAAHRAHASTAGIAAFVPAVAGFLMEKEIKIMTEAIEKPKRPLTIILGGKKIADKIGVIDNLMKRADNVLIGGGLVYTFTKANGGEIGNSIVSDDHLEYCRAVMKNAKEHKINFVLGPDCIGGDKFSNDASTRIFDTKNIRDGWEGMDLGPQTIELFKSYIAKSGTVIWCGSLGVSEIEKFANGTHEIAKAMSIADAITIAGGGDTVSSITATGFGNGFTHLSTGGGASLELLEGKTLPGVAALLNKDMEV